MKRLIVIAIVALGAFTLGAQQSPTAGMIGVTLDHTHCSLSSTNPGFCFASDGIWRQLAGDAAPVRVDVVQTPANVVTSINNKTPVNGNVTFGYVDLASKPTALNCTTSDQNNKGLTASGCAVN